MLLLKTATMPAQHSPQPSVDLTSRITVPDTVLFRELEGELVLLNLSTGVYFSLDPVGTRLWQCLQGQRGLTQTCARLVEEFDVDQARLEQDVLRFVSDLRAHGLLDITPSAS